MVENKNLMCLLGHLIQDRTLIAEVDHDHIATRDVRRLLTVAGAEKLSVRKRAAHRPRRAKTIRAECVINTEWPHFHFPVYPFRISVACAGSIVGLPEAEATPAAARIVGRSAIAAFAAIASGDFDFGSS